jgi:hypothetical protein
MPQGQVYNIRFPNQKNRKYVQTGWHADISSNSPPGTLVGRCFAGICPKMADALFSQKKRLAVRLRTNIPPKAKYA